MWKIEKWLLCKTMGFYLALCFSTLMFHLWFRAFCFLTGNSTNCFLHTFNEGKGHGSICAAPLTNALLFLILAVILDNVFIVIRAGRVRQFEPIANSSRTFFLILPTETWRKMRWNSPWHTPTWSSVPGPRWCGLPATHHGKSRSPGKQVAYNQSINQIIPAAALKSCGQPLSLLHTGW